MNFYPVVYTRASLPNTQKGTEGFGFCMRAMPPQLPKEAKDLIDQIINEDHFPRMTQPRRLFCRTDKYLFWGLGLHNEWFLPQETMDAVDMEDAEKKLRGFWGGYVEISQRTEESLLPMVLSSLLRRPGTECALTESLLDLSKNQHRAEFTAEETSFPVMDFVGRSDYVFAARLFQHFVQKDWTNFRCPVRKEDRRSHNQPIISQIPYDLRLFAPEPPQQTCTTNLPASIRVRDGHVQLLPHMSEEEEKEFWTDLILSGKGIRIVSGLSQENHVAKFPTLLVAMMLDTPAKEYVVVQPPIPKLPPIPESQQCPQPSATLTTDEKNPPRPDKKSSPKEPKKAPSTPIDVVLRPRDEDDAIASERPTRVRRRDRVVDRPLRQSSKWGENMDDSDPEKPPKQAEPIDYFRGRRENDISNSDSQQTTDHKSMLDDLED